MAESRERQTRPKSMRHKRVLDIAADNPDASFKEIAAEIPSATVDLVEHVLDEYGDPVAEDDASDEPTTDGPPADDQLMDNMGQDSTDSDGTEQSSQLSVAGVQRTASDGASEGSGPSESSGNGSDADTEIDLDLGNLSVKQQKTLRAIAENPDATQRELAEQLDVTAATISSRANSIDGFDWDERQAFVKAVFDSNADQSANAETAAELSASAVRESLDKLSDRVASIEATVDTLASEGEDTSAFEDPELVHKVVHACVHSDSISEDEELRIVRELLD